MMKNLILSAEQKLSNHEMVTLKGGTKSGSKIHNKHVQVIMA